MLALHARNLQFSKHHAYFEEKIQMLLAAIKGKIIRTRLTRSCTVTSMQTNELRREKTNVLVSDLVQHKPGCTATEDG